jgi:trans-aconitate methyltransferase
VRWLRRTEPPPAPAAAAPSSSNQGAVERASPGVAALFEMVSEGHSHAVLDLGPGSGSSLQVYTRFARWVRFADLIGLAAYPDLWAEALRALPPNPDRPYDIVFAWDILHRIPPAERPRLVQRLVQVTAPGASLLAVEPTDASTGVMSFALAGDDRMRYENAGAERSFHPPLLPAEVGRLLAPFEVLRAFTSQLGFREYLAVRPLEEAGE